MPDYLPAALPKFTDWVSLQTRKRPDYATALGLTPAEVQARAAAAVLKATADALTTSAAKVAARDEAIRTYEAQARLDIAHAKTAPGYTKAVGKGCEWLTTPGSTDLATLQPSLAIADSAQGLVLEWSKNGQNGVQVFRRATGAKNWGRVLAFDSRSPYIDTETGLNDSYEYNVQLMKDDQRVHQPSDIVSAMHGGQ